MNQKEHKIFDSFIKGGKQVNSGKDSVMFLSILVKSDENDNKLSQVITPAGKLVLKTVISTLDFDIVDELNAAMIFLEFIVHDKFSTGLRKTVAKEVYDTVYEVPFLMSYLLKLLETGNRIANSYQPAIACFVTLVATSNLDARETDEVILNIVKNLIASQPDIFTDLATLFHSRLNYVSVVETELITEGSNAPVTKPSLIEIKSLMPQHDNDFPFDYRKVSIIPTIDEMNAKLNKHRTLMSVEKPTCSDAALLLDRQFRLLREDMVAPMKIELSSILQPPIAVTGPSAAPARKPHTVFKFPQPRALSVEVDSKSASPTSYVLIEFEMSSELLGRMGRCKSKKDVETFFDSGGGKHILKRESPVFFISGDKVINMGIVIFRDAALLSFAPKSKDQDGKGAKVVVSGGQTSAAQPPVDKVLLRIGVSFVDESLIKVLSLLGGEFPLSDYMIQTKKSIFSYQPVLNCLKDMVNIPLAEELVGENPEPVFIPQRANYVFPDAIRESIESDPLQWQAANIAMRQRVTIIQGPPGTGKTYIGVQLVRALLEQAALTGEPVRIMCLCYTNHAVDSFLEDVIRGGYVALKDVVRLGRSPKISALIKERCLHEIGNELTFNRGESAEFGSCKDAQKVGERQLKVLSTTIAANQCWDSRAWDQVSFYLRDCCIDDGADDILRQFTVPQSDSDSMRVVGKGGKEIRPDAFWRDWVSGKRRPVGSAPAEEIDVWSLTAQERAALIEHWRSDQIKNYSDQLKTSMSSFSTVTARFDSLKTGKKIKLLRSMKIIAATTSAAAKLHDLLESVAPNIVLVEEAAEILESHVLTNINSSTKQLIMIGDHLQLRPKLEHHPLRKASRNGVDFDVSLFERLVKSGYPVTTLAMQHRMRPVLSAYIRHMTYPGLVDAEKTKNRENIRGMSSNMAFIDHKHFESNGDEKAVMETNSYVNTFEVDMIVQMVKHLLRQGYLCEDIVVLTPYLGQLVKIQTALKATLSLDTSLGSLDQSDLAMNANELGDFDLATVIADAESSSKVATVADEPIELIRVATIDNYQGEESRIILASLVRSNVNGEIGFLFEPERINVLFSRARDGFYVLGNADTFKYCRNNSGREMWSKLISKIKADNNLFSGFPTSCARHDTTRVIEEPAGFGTFAPNGGCDRLCGEAMPLCGNDIKHDCIKMCHAGSHERMKCTAPMKALCSRGHDSKRQCCSMIPLPCKTRVRDSTCPVGHMLEISHLCCEPVPTKCKKCDKFASEKQAAEKRLLDEKLMQRERLEAAAGVHNELEFEVQSESVKLNALQSLSRQTKETAALKKALAVTKSNTQMLERAVSEPQISQTQVEVPAPINVLTTRRLGRNETPIGRNETSSGAGEPAKPPQMVQPAPLEVEPVVLTRQKAVPSVEFGSTTAKLVYADQNPERLVANNPPSVNAPNFPMVKSSEKIVCKSSVLKRLVKVGFDQNWVEVIKLFRTLHPTNGSFSLSNADELSRLPPFVAALYLLACLELGESLFNVIEHAELLVLRLERGAIEWSDVDNAVVTPSIQSAVIEFCAFKATMAMETQSYVAADMARHIREVLELEPSGKKSQFTFPAKWLTEINDFVKKSDAALTSGKTRSGKASVVQKKASASDEWEAEKAEKLLHALIASFSKPGSGYVIVDADEDDDSPSVSLDKLMKMTGLETVKARMLSLYHTVDIAKMRKETVSANCNARFVGNPGTGKTTVARLYATFLIEVGILPDDSIVKETTGAVLKSGGDRAIKAILEEVKTADGGVIFVDEAYQLDDTQGHAVLDFILPHATDLKGEYGTVVWVFAGYTKLIDKLFEHNPGLPSRFPLTFNFEDYTEAELLKIFENLLKNVPKKPEVDKKKAKKEKAAAAAAAAKQSRSLSMPRSNYNNSNYGGSRPDETDEWGNVWKWDQPNYRFVDQYQNVTGMGASQLGSVKNPLVSDSDNSMWQFIRFTKMWSTPGKPPQVHYPGSTPPAKPVSPTEPFVVSDPKWTRIAIRRLGTLRGKMGFGNARAVLNLFNLTKERQSSRINSLPFKERQKQLYLFERDDLLGVKATRDVFASSAALQKLMSMEGLSSVKAAVQQLLELIVRRAEIEDEEGKMPKLSLNRVFLGNPGTGKTTVAAIYAEILCDFGLLSNRDIVVKKNSTDFIGDVLGQSSTKTREIINSAVGGVLIIDEAYNLCPIPSTGGTANPYKEDVITTIVEEIQNVPGEDRVVLMLGYQTEMEFMFANSNVGLFRRFQFDSPFIFEDYDNSALARILRANIIAADRTIDMDTLVAAVEIIAKNRGLPNFGNAGAVNNLLSTATLKMETRLLQNPGANKTLFVREDFVPPESTVTIEDLFRDLVGCDEVRDKLKRMCNIIEYCLKTGGDPKKEFQYNYVFTGSPGTGKTTVARLMGKIFHKYGLIATDNFVETAPSELSAGYVGQSAGKVHDVFAKGVGKVLFIDEAYSLEDGGGSFMSEVVTEMVKGLTSELLMGKMVVIMAGYEAEMRKMLKNVNPGLSSRFTEFIHFHDFTTELIVELIHKRLFAKGLELTAESLLHLAFIGEQMRTAPRFSNGRDVDTFCKKLIEEVAVRNCNEDDDDLLSMVLPVDLDCALAVFLKVKGEADKNETPKPDVVSAKPKASAKMTGSAPPPPVVATTQAVATVQPPPAVVEEVEELPAPEVEEYHKVLQDILDARGLNNKEGVLRFSTLDPSSEEFRSVAQEIAKTLGISFDSAMEKLEGWQSDQSDLRNLLAEKEKEMEKAKALGKEAMVPIWRCGVCGAANLPYIACYVAPYIVRYEKRNLV